jgi:DNA-binding IscR family transcriptional regulator
VHSAAGLAEALGLGLPTVSKVLKTLGRHELVSSQRGAHGGYALARPPTESPWPT